MIKKLKNERKQSKLTSPPKTTDSKIISRQPKKCDEVSKPKQLTTIRAWNSLLWPCFYCNISFSEFKSLQSHQESSHQKTNPSDTYYQCMECRQYLLGYAQFLNHIRSAHFKALKLCCDVCNAVLPDYKELSIHRDKHLDSSDYPIIYHCSLCDETFSTEKLLKCHTQLSHDLFTTESTKQDLLPTCKIEVNETLEILNNLKSEVLEDTSTNCEDEYHETKLMLQCGKCLKNFVSAIELRNHMNTHFDDGPYKCDECVFSFRTEEDRKYHMRAHTTKYAFTCQICKRSFARSFALKVHMRTHIGDVSCDCYICDKKFNSISDLLDHLRAGAHEERPFKCEKCTKDFKYKASFVKHKCHIPERNSFRCEICQKLYSNKKSFKNHQRRHAGGDGFECEICKKIFKKSITLKVHMGLHIGKTSLDCDICGKTFKKLTLLKRHKRVCCSPEDDHS